MKFFVVTFGCKVNQYETQALREAWQAQGAVECATPAGADIVCINSCAITGKGERDARNAVYRLRREAPQARIILTGCAAKLVESFKPRAGAPHERPDIILPQVDKARLLRLADVLAGEAATPNAHAFPPFAITRFSRARPVLKVQDGCAHRCTYCIVPLTRGKPQSREPAAITAEAERLFAAGYAELMVSGINLSQYGRDKPEYGDFWGMLRMLDTALAPQWAGKARLRISSLEPSQLQERGLGVLTSCVMLCPHLHISLQHTSPAVLKRMGRGHYGVGDLYRALERLHAHWPRMGLGCDLLVGFPGESEADVECLLRDIANLPLSYAHVFPYSARPGTAAATFPHQIPKREKEARARAVREAVAQRQQIFLQDQLDCETMLLAPDLPQEAGHNASAPRGVNQFYADCEISDSLPPNASQRGLIPVRPQAVRGTSLVVSPL